MAGRRVDRLRRVKHIHISYAPPSRGQRGREWGCALRIIMSGAARATRGIIITSGITPARGEAELALHGQADLALVLCDPSARVLDLSPQQTLRAARQGCLSEMSQGEREVGPCLHLNLSAPAIASSGTA
jgi:hypothetical protein